ncbi:MAG: nitroreductase family deazaflavin-dependent oxidoreductase [Myxococcales bacterium]|nr:nitroreductase family deazaflavin-dependent oxidoreductase [Myxococcales bacterium]
MNLDNQNELTQALQRVGAEEARIGPTLAGSMLRKIGPSRLFAAVYRHLGPMIDPWLHKKTGGRIGSRLYGFTALLLCTTGAKSGKPRTSPLIYARDGDDFLVVGTNFGTKNHPAWTANLRAQPRAAIEVGQERLQVEAEQLDDAGFAQHWPKFSSIYPGYDAYLKRLTDRTPRMFRLRPVGVEPG